MFERFTRRARTAVERAADEARRRRSGHVEPRHVLLALAADPDGIAGRALARTGVDAAALGRAVDRLGRTAAPGTGAGDLDSQDKGPAEGVAPDEAALATLGIDLAEVRRRAEAAFGPGALDRGSSAGGGRLPFAAETKRALEQSLREAVALRHRYLGTEHLLLGLLAAGTADVTAVLADLGVAPDRLRTVVLALLADVSRSA